MPRDICLGMDVINLESAFETIDESWEPKFAGQLNDHAVKVARVEGTFVWHDHVDTDELFFVHSGRLRIEMEDREDAELGPGEFTIVPRGVSHRPVAPEETFLLLVEKQGTSNTGDVDTDLTTTEVESLDP